MSRPAPEWVRLEALRACGARTRGAEVCRPGAAVEVSITDGLTIGWDRHVWIPTIRATRGSGLALDLVLAVHQAAARAGWGLVVTPILDEAVGFWERVPALRVVRDPHDPFLTMVAPPPAGGSLETLDGPAEGYGPILVAT